MTTTTAALYLMPPTVARPKLARARALLSAYHDDALLFDFGRSLAVVSTTGLVLSIEQRALVEAIDDMRTAGWSAVVTARRLMLPLSFVQGYHHRLPVLDPDDEGR